MKRSPVSSTRGVQCVCRCPVLKWRLTDLLYVNEYAAPDARVVRQGSRSGHVAAPCLRFLLTHLSRQC